MPQKAVAAGGATALAGALTTIIFSLWGHPASPELEQAVQLILGMLASGIATYWTKMEGQ